MPLTDDEIYVLWCKRLGGSGLWPKSGGPVPLSAALVAGIRSAMREAYDRACENCALMADDLANRAWRGTHNPQEPTPSSQAATFIASECRALKHEAKP